MAAAVGFLLERHSQCKWALSLACLSDHSHIFSQSWFYCLTLQSPAKNADFRISLPWWGLLRSPKEYVKCEQWREKEPEKVFCYFSQNPISKTGHAWCSFLLGSEGTWRYLSCWVAFSFSVTHKFTKYVKNFSTSTFLGEWYHYQSFRRWVSSCQTTETFCFSTTDFICTSQNILWFDLAQLIFF